MSLSPKAWARGLVFTCEHASKRIPKNLLAAFSAGEALLGAPADEVVMGHRGFDAGARALAVALARAAGTVPLMGQVSRLVIDLNRSQHHPRLFSPITRALPVAQRRELLARYWQPHVQAVTAAVAAAAGQPLGCVHLAMHSFTPLWEGEARAVDIGLLYDPKRARERQVAQALAAATKRALPQLRVRYNQPYRGTADGLPCQLRRAFTDGQYAGIEIEVSQALVHNRRRWPLLATAMVTAWQQALTDRALHCD